MARRHRVEGARPLHVHCMHTARTIRSMSMSMYTACACACALDVCTLCTCMWRCPEQVHAGVLDPTYTYHGRWRC